MDLISKKDLEQHQKAGDNSMQIMVAGNFNTGITESQARDICKAECAIALQNWAFQAGAYAEARIQKLEDRVVPKMLAHDNQLRIFGDPAFQILLRKAQISAASTERDNDYEMLSDLLLHRAEQNDNRTRRLGISKAIEIVDQVDDLALIALSVVYAISKYIPVSNRLSEGLNVLNDLFMKIIDGRHLPSDPYWIDHLDLLAAVRLTPKGYQNFKKIEEYIPERLNKYFEVGLQIDSDDYKLVIEKFRSLGIPVTCIESHPLKNGYVHLTSPKEVENIVITYDSNQGSFTVPLSDQQKNAFSFAYEIAFKSNCNDPEMLSSFWKAWDRYSVLKNVKDWWNNLNDCFSFTPVGVALANAYIRGKYPTIPSLY